MRLRHLPLLPSLAPLLEERELLLLGDGGVILIMGLLDLCLKLYPLLLSGYL